MSHLGIRVGVPSGALHLAHIWAHGWVSHLAHGWVSHLAHGWVSHLAHTGGCPIWRIGGIFSRHVYLPFNGRRAASQRS